MSKENYEQKLAVFTAMPASEAKEPNMPVDTAVQEAHNLFAWATDDKEMLINHSALDWEFAQDLPIRAGALSYAQSLWVRERYGQEEANIAWKEQSVAAYKLRDDLLDDFRYAYRKRADLLSRVREISGGRGGADMIQDLSDLNVLGKGNTELLIAAKFNLAKLDKAANWSSRLREVLAKANGATKENTLVKQIRDKAFTHAKETVDEIRDAGKYVFKDNPERYQGYISTYRKK